MQDFKTINGLLGAIRCMHCIHTPTIMPICKFVNCSFILWLRPGLVVHMTAGCETVGFAWS